MSLAFATLTFNLIPPLPDTSGYALQLRFVAAQSEGENLFGPWPCTLDFTALHAQVNPTEYGRLLTIQLLSDAKASARCCSLLDSVNLTNTPLRLIFALPIEDVALCQVHWETLCHPATQALLTTQANVWCTRLPYSDNLRPVQLRPKGEVQAVLAAANPTGLAQLRLAEVDTDGELARARTAVRGWTCLILPDETGTQRVTLDNLLATLRTGADVLYLACHGRLVNAEPKLMLEDDKGQLAITSGIELTRRVGELNPLPRLIVLASCQSADVATEKALAALGPRLAAEGVPAVLAMLGQVSMATVKKFMPVFFAELAKDGQIDRALAVARGAVQIQTDWWMPVLFLRATSGQLWAQDSAIPAPAQPDQPPNSERWVGRATELAQCVKALQQHHWVAIFGAPGVGKTALGAKLMQIRANTTKVFWYKFTPKERLGRLLWKLAECLAWHGQDTAWATLQAFTKAGNPAPKEALIAPLLQILRDGHYLLGLDDCHYLDDDPEWGQFVEQLLALAQAGAVQVVFTAQRRPAFVAVEAAPLAGLNLAEAQALCQAQNLVALTAEQLQALHAKTGGNALLLQLAVEVLRRATNPTQQIQALFESVVIEKFLIERVAKSLAAAELEVMRAVAVLSAFPGSRQALTAMLDGENMQQTLRELTNRGLLQEQTQAGERVYGQTELLREYFYESLALSKRKTLHRRAAEFYAEGTTSIPAHFRTTLHYQRAGEPAQAVQVIEHNLWPILNRGLAKALREVLEAFTEKQLTERDWATVLWARGQTYAFLGEAELAHASYEAVLKRVHPAEHAAYAQACLGLGELLRHEAPAEAQRVLEIGLKSVQGTGTPTEAALLIQLGVALFLQEDNAGALEKLNAGLELLDSAPSSLRATALMNLGIVSCEDGALAQGLPYFEQALAIHEQLRNVWGMISAWHNLAFVLDYLGRWTEALDYCELELSAAEHIGSLAKQFNALYNLGLLQTRHGPQDAAERTLQRALEIARRRNSRSDQSYVLPALAGLYLDTHQPERARPLLVEAEHHLQAGGNRSPAPETARQWARLCLIAGQLTEAEQHIRHSLALAEELKKPNDTGFSLRILALIQLAQHQPAAARASLEQSLATLSGVDAHEFEQTQKALAQLQSTDTTVDTTQDGPSKV